MSYYKIDQLAPTVYRFHDPFSVNFFLVVGADKALLLDAGYGVVPVLPEIRTITDKPLEVVLSHGHVDHANGAFDFEQVWMHEADMKVLGKHTTFQWRHNLALEAIGKGIEIDPEVHANKPCPTINFLTAGQNFDLGDVVCEVVAMPGHTAGSIGILVKEERILLASDAASHMIWLWMEESALVKDYAQMLKVVNELEFDYFYTGHTDWKNEKKEFEKLIRVAEAANFADSKEYNEYDAANAEAYVYEEGDTAVVFSKRTIGAE